MRRAVTFSRFGGPEVMEVSELAVPDPGPGEVRIRVAAATVNPTDIGFRAGRHLNAAQLAEIGVKPPYVPGMELAGVVDAVGAGAPWRVGDHLMAIVNPRRPSGGAQAEEVVVPSASVARVPEGTSLEAAATLPMNGLTVRLALDQLALKPGQTLGVTGAAGAVGAYAVQLGALEGLRVFAVAASKDEALLKGLGAEKIVPRGDGAIPALRETVPAGLDGLIDAALLDAAALPALRDGGKFASVRGWSGWVGPAERGIAIQRVLVSAYFENHAALEQLGRLVSAGRLTLRVAGTFPPEDAGRAQELLAAGGTRGRLVIAF